MDKAVLRNIWKRQRKLAWRSLGTAIHDVAGMYWRKP